MASHPVLLWLAGTTPFIFPLVFLAPPSASFPFPFQGMLLEPRLIPAFLIPEMQM